jgi:hypothetical protein
LSQTLLFNSALQTPDSIRKSLFYETHESSIPYKIREHDGGKLAGL